MKKLFVLVTNVFAICALSLLAEEWNFSNRPISEILFSISAYTEIPITADDTVSGNADFRFSGGSFETAFDSFLLANRLYVEKSSDLWTVSRVRIFKTDDGFFVVDACDVKPTLLAEKLGIALQVGVSFSVPPIQTVTVHKSFSEPIEILRFIVRQLPDYEVFEKDGSFHVERIEKNAKNNAFRNLVVKTGENLFSADIRGATFLDCLDSLCQTAKKQFCLLSSASEKIERLVVENKTFNEVLELLCTQSGFSTIEQNEIIYVFSEKNKKNDFTATGKTWSLFELKFTEVNKIIHLLNSRFGDTKVLSLPDGKSFMMLLAEKETASVEDFVKRIDVMPKNHLVQLKYISTLEFLAHLPPSVQKENIVDAGTGNSFFFTGSDDSYEQLLLDIPLRDKPVERIRYDLLIMQYEDTKSSDWSASIGANRLQLGDRNALTAQLGSVLSFNLDVVSAFGLQFAAQMQASIQENKAHVFADTTLHGISGAAINFQNTNTYRYRDNNLDPETGKPVYSGITREIVSGLKLEVQGFVSGDGMITSKVTASVSRQGTDVSSTTGNPPPTSEKVITTEVCCKSGEPVVLSGLVQSSKTQSAQRTPFLSKIPLLGLLFKAENKASETTDMVIYLVPHREVVGENNSFSGSEYDFVTKADDNDGFITEKDVQFLNKILEMSKKDDFLEARK